METNFSQKKTSLLQLVANTNSYNLRIPEIVEFKIREWCRLNPSTEWSGTLFYTTNGSFENNTIEFIVRDFFVMDIGTGGSTDFKETPEICAYMMDNNLLDCKTGLIHSHNSMSAFFSGTDAHTLIEEGEQTVHFLSLVVNNAGSYVARVTRKVVESVEGVKHLKFSTFNGVEISKDEIICTTDREVIMYNDLNIIVESPFRHIIQSTEARFKELKSVKKVVTTPAVFNNNTAPKAWTSQRVEIPVKATSVVKKEPVEQPTLFKNDDIECGDNVDVSDMAKELAIQLLFGNVLLSPASFDKFTKVNEWITTNMERALDKRFGSDKAGLSAYQEWMGQFCEFLVWEYADKLVSSKMILDTESAACKIALRAQAFLEELILKAFNEKDIDECAVNKYLNYIIDQLMYFAF